MEEQLLRAREARQEKIDRACAPGQTVVFASTSIPGPQKSPDGLDSLFGDACERLGSRLDAVLLDRGVDAAGPWALFRTTAPPDRAKRTSVGIETAHPAGRLLDIDVYSEGRQVDRASLGLPPRPCLVCERPAVECIRLKRHGMEELVERVHGLLGSDGRHRSASGEVRLRGASGELGPRAASARQAASRATERLAACLVAGARIELALTPKPGLVDRRDNGSHPDLSYALMTRSIGLLPQYFEELLAAGQLGLAAGTGLEPGGSWIPACIDAGRRAERRMIEVVGSNAHRGYIFLAGLTLLGSLQGEDHLRGSIRGVARDVIDVLQGAGDALPSHGAEVRARHAVGGVVREALDGLPAVFDHGLPAVRSRRAAHDDSRGADTDEPLYYGMAVLMQVVEDTTAVHRVGPRGLERLRRDGRQLQETIEQGRPFLPWLDELNTEYRRLNLTMGGVADCLAITVALDRWSEGPGAVS